MNSQRNNPGVQQPLEQMIKLLEPDLAMAEYVDWQIQHRFKHTASLTLEHVLEAICVSIWQASFYP